MGRGPSAATGPAPSLLDQEELPEELARLQRGLEPYHRVQEHGLLDFPDRVGVVERGDPDHQRPGEVAHGLHGFPDQELAVPQIGADPTKTFMRASAPR